MGFVSLTAHFGDAAENGSVEIARTTTLTNSDGNVFEDHKRAFVPQSFLSRNASSHHAAAMLASKVVHRTIILRRRR